MSKPADNEVSISVHDRLDAPDAPDAPGFVVKVVARIGGHERTTRWPVEDKDEAVALAKSVKAYINGGGDVTALLPDDEEGEP